MPARSGTILLTLAWIGFVLYLGLLPRLPQVPVVVSDRSISPLGHFSAYLVLGGLAYLVVSTQPSSWLRRTGAIAAAVAFSAGVGAGVEGLQVLLTETRAAQVSDLIMDTTGSVIGAGAVLTLEQLQVSRQYLSIAAASIVVALMFMGSAGIVIWNPSLPRVGDHWHASYQISVCGKVLPPLRGTPGSVHTHGDRRIHIHPATAGEAGRNATLALFFATSGGQLTDRSLTLPSGESYTDGYRCPDGRRGKLRVVVNGKLVDQPSTYIVRNKDRISIEIQAEIQAAGG